MKKTKKKRDGIKGKGVRRAFRKKPKVELFRYLTHRPIIRQEQAAQLKQWIAQKMATLEKQAQEDSLKIERSLTQASQAKEGINTFLKESRSPSLSNISLGSKRPKCTGASFLRRRLRLQNWRKG